MRIALLALAAFLTVTAAYAENTDLPDIGTPADTVLTLDDEYQIGRMVVKQLRDAGKVLEDPEVTEYLQSIGNKLASHSLNSKQKFYFFAVKDATINAFALPGGFIGINSGLLLATANESELAGVLAHEIAHVTQRHIARGIRAQGRSTLVSTAAMLAAILIGVSTGASSDALMGAVAVAQGAAAQQQLNFTRSNESEADRVAIATLVAAGFDPKGMPDFFETLGRHVGGTPGQVPEFLQTHPLTTTRVAEARSRVREYPKVAINESISYRLTRERLRVLNTPRGMDPYTHYEKLISTEKKLDDGHRYGRALALTASGKPEEAIPLLNGLIERNDGVIQYRIALGQAQLQMGSQREALETFAHGLTIFPRNVPLTVRYAEALMRANQAPQAHKILLDLFNMVPPTPEQARFIALCANTAGDVAESYYYMSEFHVMSGDLMLAIDQLQMALAVPKLTNVQKSRFQARIDELREYVPAKERVAERVEGDDDKNDRRPRRYRRALVP